MYFKMNDTNQSDDTLDYDSTEEFQKKFIPGTVTSLEGKYLIIPSL